MPKSEMFLVLKVFCIDCAVARRMCHHVAHGQVSLPGYQIESRKLTPVDQLGVYPDPSSFLYMLIRANRKHPDKLLAP